MSDELQAYAPVRENIAALGEAQTYGYVRENITVPNAAQVIPGGSTPVETDSAIGQPVTTVVGSHYTKTLRLLPTPTSRVGSHYLKTLRLQPTPYDRLSGAAIKVARFVRYPPLEEDTALAGTVISARSVRNLRVTSQTYSTATVAWDPPTGESPPSITFDGGDFPEGLTSVNGAPTIVNFADATAGTTKAIQCADLGDGTATSYSFSVNCPAAGALTFRYWNESEGNYDRGFIEVDGVQIVNATGIWGSWSEVSTQVSAGVHVIKVSFTKDGSQSQGFDNIRISKITIPGGGNSEYRIDGGTITVGTSPLVVTGLSGGQTRLVEVRPINGVGFASIVASAKTPSLYDAAVTADAPWAYYRLEDPVGTTFADDSGNGRSMPLSAVPAANLQAKLKPLLASGVRMDGQYGTLPTGLLGGDVTIEFWWKPTVLNTLNDILGIDGESRIIRFGDAGIAAGRLQAGLGNNGATSPTELVAVGVLHHIVLRYTASTGACAVFIDGIKVWTFNQNANGFTGTTARWLYGSYGERPARGYFSNLAFYKAPLSDERILAHYAAADINRLVVGGRPPVDNQHVPSGRVPNGVTYTDTYTTNPGTRVGIVANGQWEWDSATSSLQQNAEAGDSWVATLDDVPNGTHLDYSFDFTLLSDPNNRRHLGAWIQTGTVGQRDGYRVGHLDNTWRVDRWTDQGSPQVTSTTVNNVPINLNQTYRFRATRNYDTGAGEFYVDDVLVMTWSDLNADLPTGRPGFWVYAGKARIDNVRAVVGGRVYTEDFTTNPFLPVGRVKTLAGNPFGPDGSGRLGVTNQSQTASWAVYPDLPREAQADISVDLTLIKDSSGRRHAGFFLQGVDGDAVTGYRVVALDGGWTISRYSNGGPQGELANYQGDALGLNQAPRRIRFTYNATTGLAKFYIDGVQRASFTDPAYTGLRPGYFQYGGSPRFDNLLAVSSTVTPIVVAGGVAAQNDTAPTGVLGSRVPGGITTEGQSALPGTTTALGPPAAGYAAVVMADTPIAYYRLNESSMANPLVMKDSSGNGRHGTFTGTGTAGMPSLVSDSDTAALSVPSSGIGTVPYDAWMNPTLMTHEAWVKPNTVGAGTRVIGGRTSLDSFSNPNAYQMFAYQVGNKWGMSVRGTGNPGDAIESVGSAEVDKVQHIVATYDGTWGRLYVNGTLAASVAIATTLRGVNLPLAIGACGIPGYGFAGVVDEYAVYDQALSPERIAAHYNAGRGTPAATTVTGTTAVEGEVALAGTVAQRLSGGTTTELDTASTGTVTVGVAATIVPGGLTVEGEVCLSGLTTAGARLLGSTCAEVDIALAGGTRAGSTLTGGIGFETDAVPPATTNVAAPGTITILGGTAPEGEIALAATVRAGARIAASTATETDTAPTGTVRSAGAPVTLLGGLAIEGEVARAGAVVDALTTVIPLDVVTERESAQPIVPQLGTEQSVALPTVYEEYRTGYITQPIPAAALTITLFDSDLDSTPESVSATIGNGLPYETITFDLVGPATASVTRTAIATATLDDTGATIVDVALPGVPAGTYTLRVHGTSSTLAYAPIIVREDALSEDPEPDNEPVPPVVPVTVHWQLVDTTPGQERHYVFTHNPAKWTNPDKPLYLEHKPTTAPDGNLLAWQGADRSWTFEFSGTTLDQAEYQELQFWASLRRRFWLIDHRGQARYVTFAQFDTKARTVPNRPWVHDYTMRVVHFFRSATDSEEGT